MLTFSEFCVKDMKFLYFFGLITGVFNDGVAGRAINISSVWFLPQDGFPVFYRYFNDKVTWNEAEAVCGFHHADLLSVQTTTQMDAARAYLKELDITDDIWIGLQKDSPENPFSWTNGEKLLGDGYWTEPIPKTNEKLCAALDPVADFRWNSFYCRGPQVASFVCELPVPDWAKKDNGCLITSLPSLTVTLLPDVGVIQLLSDCGLDGTRRIACNDGMNREEVIKRLSCDGFGTTTNSQSTTVELTRHKRNAETTTNAPLRDRTIHNVPSHGFPHSPYLASVRNAPSTRRPKTVRVKNKVAAETPSPVVTTPNTTNILSVLIIEKLNESSATSENPQLLLMIENKDLEEPFLVPLSDDIFINNPSLSPVEVINVDLVEVDNTTNVSSDTVKDVPSTTSHPDAEEVLNGLQGAETPQKPNRGRFLTHSNHPSFYPRFLNRVLG